MKKLLSFLFLGSFLLLAACEKYEEGPSLSLRSKKARVANEWKINYAYDFNDKIEITADFAGEIWEFTKDGQFYEKVNEKLDKSGTWDFISDKEEIAVSFPDKIIKYKILRLKENEMWLENQEEELRLIPN